MQVRVCMRARTIDSREMCESGLDVLDLGLGIELVSTEQRRWDSRRELGRVDVRPFSEYSVSPDIHVTSI